MPTTGTRRAFYAQIEWNSNMKSLIILVIIVLLLLIIGEVLAVKIVKQYEQGGAVPAR
jgi:hypothetical protein